MWPFEVKSSKHILEFAHAQMQFFSTPTLSTTLLLAWSQTWSGTSTAKHQMTIPKLKISSEVRASKRRNKSVHGFDGVAARPRKGEARLHQRWGEFQFRSPDRVGLKVHRRLQSLHGHQNDFRFSRCNSYLATAQICDHFLFRVVFYFQKFWISNFKKCSKTI